MVCALSGLCPRFLLINLSKHQFLSQRSNLSSANASEFQTFAIPSLAIILFSWFEMTMEAIN